MKKLALLVFIVSLSWPAGLSAFAQDKKPKTWEEKKAARLKPVPAAQKQVILEALPEKASARPQKARRVLVFWRCEGFIHTSIPWGNFALERMGEKTGAFKADLADDYSVFTPGNLGQYDAIVFNNTTHLAFENDAQRNALMDFMKQGKGVAGIHAASDSFYKWKLAASMIGGQFNGHPWTAGGTWAFKLDDPGHILNQAFMGRGFWHKDEIYQYKPDTYVGEEKLRILVSLDMSKPEVTGVLDNERYERFNKVYGAGAREVPVSWLREFGGGRVFYSNLGHREDTYQQAAILQHFLDGIQYALGDLKADATPTAKAGKSKPAPAPGKK